MGIFNKIFNKNTPEKRNETEKSSNNSAEINFDELVEKARTSGNATDLELLYRSFLKLENWVFIVSENCEIENAKPFIGVFEELPWLYVFTDSLKADFYAKLFGNFHSNEGNTMVLKMTRFNSLNMLKELNNRGVYGVRINEGENGWFCNIQELFGIIEHYKIKTD